MADQFDLYRAEMVSLTPEERRLDRPTDPKLMGGYWRIVRAKTCHDTPVMIWTKDGAAETVFQRGARRGIVNAGWEVVHHDISDAEAATHFVNAALDFPNKDWLKCIPVTKADWASAIETGFWPDRKPARQMSQDEKLGIDTGAGANDAPPEELLADQISSLADKLSKVVEPKTQAEADALTGDLDRMRALLKKAGAEREEEYRPHKEAADTVSAKWAGIMKPGQDAGTSAEAKRKAFLKKEQARLDAEAAAERKRLADEAEARRIQAEKDAKAKGEPAPVAQPEPIPEVETKRATAGTAFGRQSGLRKTPVGIIDDLPMLVNHLVFSGNGPDPDFKAYIDERVKKAAKAGVALPGMHIEEQML